MEGQVLSVYKFQGRMDEQPAAQELGSWGKRLANVLERQSKGLYPGMPDTKAQFSNYLPGGKMLMFRRDLWIQAHIPAPQPLSKSPMKGRLGGLQGVCWHLEWLSLTPEVGPLQDPRVSPGRGPTKHVPSQIHNLGSLMYPLV